MTDTLNNLNKHIKVATVYGHDERSNSPPACVQLRHLVKSRQKQTIANQTRQRRRGWEWFTARFLAHTHVATTTTTTQPLAAGRQRGGITRSPQHEEKQTTLSSTYHFPAARGFPVLLPHIDILIRLVLITD